MSIDISTILPLVTGALLPPLIDLINRKVPSAKARFIVSGLVCLVIAIASNINQLRFGNDQEALMSFSLIWTGAQAAYQLAYKDSKLQTALRDSTKDEPVKLDSDPEN